MLLEPFASVTKFLLASKPQCYQRQPPTCQWSATSHHTLQLVGHPLAFSAWPAHLRAISAAEADVFLQSGDAEKDKLRASLGSAILAERPNVKVSASYAMVMYISVLSMQYACSK